MALKTDNTQESRQFNPTSGEYNYLTKTGSLTLSQDNEQVTIPNGSDLMVVDLGITIDRSDAQITVGGNVLEVLYFVSKSDLVGVELGTGKCAILTEEPNFRTVVYLSVEQLNKSMSYQVSSLNNSLPSYELNDIARQLNAIGGSPVIPDTGNILDGGTADFRVQLTNPNTTRTLANGEVLGQTATLFNATANTITVTDGSFTFTVLANDKREVQWNGIKWESKANLETANIENATTDTLTVQTKATVPTPTENEEATNKSYVDTSILNSKEYPDYTNPITVSATTSYQDFVAPEDGFVFCSLGGSQTKAGVLINDFFIYGAGAGNSTYFTTINGMLKVKKNDVIRFRSGTTSTQVSNNQIVFFAAVP